MQRGEGCTLLAQQLLTASSGLGLALALLCWAFPSCNCSIISFRVSEPRQCCRTLSQSPWGN